MEPSTLASRHWRLAVTAGAALAVLVTTLLLAPHSPGAVGTTTPAIVYVLLVLAAALVGGRPAGLVTAALALIAQVYYFVPPDHGFSIQGSRNAIGVIVFALAELIVCLVGASQRHARLRAESAGAVATRLQRFTSSLSRALTTQAVYDVALEEGRELLGANGGLVALPVDDGCVELVASFGFSDEETAAWRRFPLSQRTPIGAAIEDGLPVFLGEGEREVLFPRRRSARRSDGVRAAAGRRRDDRRARIPLRPRPRLRRLQPRIRSDDGRAVRLRAAARTRVRR